MEAAAQVKQHGLENDLVDRIRASEYFAPIQEKLEDLLKPSTFIGRAPQQVHIVAWPVCGLLHKILISTSR